MASEHEFINPNDQAALLAFANADLLNQTREILENLGYKSHLANNHDDFLTSYGQMEYQLVIIEELFNAATPEENLSLQRVAALPMSSRRHSVFVVLGMNFQTLNAMQAFQLSVHAVVNYSEFSSLPEIIKKVVADNNLFLHTYRESSRRLAEGKNV